MVKRRGGTRLAPEALEGMRIILDVGRQKLERDEASEFGVSGFVDDAHPAATEFLDDPIVRNDAADHVRNMLVPNSTLVNESVQFRDHNEESILRLDCSFSWITGKPEVNCCNQALSLIDSIPPPRQSAI